MAANAQFICNNNYVKLGGMDAHCIVQCGHRRNGYEYSEIADERTHLIVTLLLVKLPYQTQCKVIKRYLEREIQRMFHALQFHTQGER